MRKNTKKALSSDFCDGVNLKPAFQNFEKIIVDRRSVYSVSIGFVDSHEKVKEFLKQTKKIKNHHKATHHTWAMRFVRDGVISESKNDGGEAGAGRVILQILQQKDILNVVVCVTRWYGGIKLDADRFRHVQDATLHAINLAGR